MPTPTARDALYSRLTEVLGAGPAETLMSYLPDQQPATRGDVDDLRREIGAVRDDLRREIGAVGDELRAEIVGLRSELRAEIGELRAELRTDLRALEERVNGLYQAFHAQTRVHVAASLGSAVTVGGLVFIAAQLV